MTFLLTFSILAAPGVVITSTAPFSDMPSCRQIAVKVSDALADTNFRIVEAPTCKKQ